jgi:iron complex transport system substrate-binding protein
VTCWRPLLVAALLAGCTPQAAPPAAERAPTIVSLNPCTDAILAEVAGPEQVLALSHYSHDPRSSSMDVAKARRFGVTGGTVEEVLALQPDLVVAGAFMPPATRAGLEDLGIRVETFGIASTIADSDEQIRRLAALAGKPKGGEALVAKINTALLAAAPRAGFTPVATVLWQPSGIVPGEGALVSELLRRAGFASHSAAIGMGQADYLSLEQVIANPPELLLVAGQERSQLHPALDALPGMRRAGFDPGLLYCGGPTIIRAMERLRAIRDALAAAPPPTPSSKEEGALTKRNPLPLFFRGGGWGVVAEPRI